MKTKTIKTSAEELEYASEASDQYNKNIKLNTIINNDCIRIILVIMTMIVIMDNDDCYCIIHTQRQMKYFGKNNKNK